MFLDWFTILYTRFGTTPCINMYPCLCSNCNRKQNTIASYAMKKFGIECQGFLMLFCMQRNEFICVFRVQGGGGGGGALNLDIFSLEMLRWFLVCVICNSKSFHSLIFKLCIMIVHTLNMCLSFLCKFDKHFLIYRAVELRHSFPSEMLRGCLICVICNSSSFHSFIFKLCIMSGHTLNMYTPYLCTFDNKVLSV